MHLRNCRCDEVKHDTLAGSTGSDKSWAQLESWIQKCNKDHKICKLRSLVEWMPARVLDVGPPNGSQEPLLCMTNQNTPVSPYVTLSHCWGSPDGPRPPTLTIENMGALSARILLESLPKTFQDAVKVVRKLRLRYLWIDSLCIQQDSADDWLRESAQMHNVYKYAILNIAADGATNSSGGLFHERNPQNFGLAQIEKVQICGMPEGDYLCVSKQHNFDGRDSPLRRRAWVVQERLLSPRQVSFGSDVVSWKCCESYACEFLPELVPVDSSREPLEDTGRSEREMCQLIALHDMNGRRMESSQKAAEDVYQARVRMCWYKIIEEYTACVLTNSKDKLTAIQGIVKHMQPILNDEYFAGIWRQNLIIDLLWGLKDGLQSDSTLAYRPAAYRAPSWSWASVEGNIVFNRKFSSYHMIAVLDADVTPIGNDKMGPVKDGFVAIRGRLIKYCNSLFRLHPNGYPSAKNSDIEYAWQQHQNSNDDVELVYCKIDDIACWRDWDRENIWLLPIVRDDLLHDGLLLCQTSEKNRFKRLGVFEHCAVVTNQWPLSEMYDEQEDQVITLV